jgi:hypothetical protein
MKTRRYGAELWRKILRCAFNSILCLNGVRKIQNNLKAASQGHGLRTGIAVTPYICVMKQRSWTVTGLAAKMTETIRDMAQLIRAKVGRPRLQWRELSNGRFLPNKGNFKYLMTPTSSISWRYTTAVDWSIIKRPRLQWRELSNEHFLPNKGQLQVS